MNGGERIFSHVSFKGGKEDIREKTQVRGPNQQTSSGKRSSNKRKRVVDIGLWNARIGYGREKQAERDQTQYPVSRSGRKKEKKRIEPPIVILRDEARPKDRRISKNVQKKA